MLENRRRLRARRGRAALRRAQVHGAASRACAPTTRWTRSRASRPTACAATPPTSALGVFVADCIPALIADARTGAFAAVHAGWRGTLAGVAAGGGARAWSPSFGARPQDLRVALGPAIGACCFEVGPEVVEAVAARDPGARDAGRHRRAAPAAARTSISSSRT